jgi:hypothetical protein
MPRIHINKNLSDSIKTNFIIHYRENGYPKNFSIEFYKMRKRFFPFWYFVFPTITNDNESIGPFWTKRGAIKYAKNLLINGIFLNDK